MRFGFICRLDDTLARGICTSHRRLWVTPCETVCATSTFPAARRSMLALLPWAASASRHTATRCAGLRSCTTGRPSLEPEFFAALDVFRERNGHAHVPATFVVPGGDSNPTRAKATTATATSVANARTVATAALAEWPPATRGLALGARVAGLRRRRKRGTLADADEAALSARGFVWDVSEWQWSRVIGALRAYKKLHGQLASVPRDFVVPHQPMLGTARRREVTAAASNDTTKTGLEAEQDWPWPPEAAGIKLASTISNIRSKQRFIVDRPHRRAELDALGFEWGGRYDAEWELVHRTLAVYRDVRGDLLVPQAFVVPSCAPWPTDAWGLRLGSRVDNIRSQRAYVKGRPTRIAQLEELGFVWNDRERRWDEVISALRAYKAAHGDLEVPQHFVVPATAAWPEHVHGLPLGSRVNKIRFENMCVKGRPERRAELDALGFVWRDTPRRRKSVAVADVATSPRGITRVRGTLKVVSTRTM